MSSKSILVTGGFGYLGGRLVQSLTMDNSALVHIGTRSMRNEAQWAKRAKVVHMNYKDSDSLSRATEGIDSVVHLSTMGYSEAEMDPKQSLLDTGLNTLKLIEAAKKSGCESFIYVSSSHVYGANLVGKVDESVLPNPTTQYGISHRLAEDFVMRNSIDSSMRSVIFRLSNCFGAPAHPDISQWHLFVNNLCKSIVQQGLMDIKSNAGQFRDFFPISDAVAAIKFAIFSDNRDCIRGLYNIGAGQSRSLIEMANLVGSRFQMLTGNKISPQTRSASSPASPYFEFCVDKIHSTGFEMRCNFDIEIDDCLNFCSRVFEN